MIHHFPKMQAIIQEGQQDLQKNYPFLSDNMARSLTFSLLNNVLSRFNTEEVSSLIDAMEAEILAP